MLSSYRATEVLISFEGVTIRAVRSIAVTIVLALVTLAPGHEAIMTSGSPDTGPAGLCTNLHDLQKVGRCGISFAGYGPPQFSGTL